MSDIAVTTTSIAVGIALLCFGGAWLWLGIEEVIRRRREWRKSRPDWMRILQQETKIYAKRKS